MKKITYSLFLFIFCFGLANAQKAEDVIILEVKTNYKVHYQGESLFNENCSSCHGINEKNISVGLSDVHTKRSREWLLEFLQRPQTLEYSDDPETLKYKEEYVIINHEIIRGIDEKEYTEILDFLESELNGPTYDNNRLKEQYFVLQKNELVKVGDYKYYFPDGKLSYWYKYNNGLPWEVIEVYDVFGEKKDGGTLNNGTGTIVTYDKYGNKESATTYTGGFRSGEFKQYFDGGQVKMMGFYTNGKANGRWAYYYPNGTVKNYINYKNGRIISNREGDRPDYHPGIAAPKNYSNGNTKPSTNQNPVKSTPTTITNIEETIIYPYNAKITWDRTQISQKQYTDLGNELFSRIILKKKENIYADASVNFKRYHPSTIMDKYIAELNSYGEFEFYRMDNIGFTKVDGRSLILMEYYLSFPSQKIKMYVSYVLQQGVYKLDGLSYEPAVE